MRIGIIMRKRKKNIDLYAAGWFMILFEGRDTIC